MSDHEESITWVPVSVIALEYQRTPQFIRRWCSSGYILELGYSLRRDSLGHWLVGVPTPLFERFCDTAKTGI